MLRATYGDVAVVVIQLPAHQAALIRSGAERQARNPSLARSTGFG
jgi:hypothetical protein